MTLNLTIIENNSVDLIRLTEIIKKWSQAKTIPVSISSYSSAEKYFAEHQTHESNAFFIDIQLMGIDGISAAKRLRAENYSGEIIFLTSYKEYVFDGYQVRALNFLIKPAGESSVFPCLNELEKSVKKQYYIFHIKQDLLKIDYKDILSFSSSLHSIDIITQNGHYTQYASLTNILEKLPREFVRVHRSHIVNMAHINKISGNTITLSNHTKVPIGRLYINDIRTAFSEYSMRLDTPIL